MTSRTDKAEPIRQPDIETAPRAAAVRRECLLVLGMHRSGTSALTRTLSLAGLSLPANLLSPTEGNETGHWEPSRLVAYHDSILTELGSSWRDWRGLEFGRIAPARRNEIKAEISRILAEEYEGAPLLVVKDPRICRFAPLFIEALSDAELDARAVLPIRNPMEVCGSLAARDGMSEAAAGLLWLRHVLDAEYATRSLNRAIVSHHGFLSDWKTCLNELSGQLGLRWPKGVEEIAARVDSFLRHDLRHQESTTEDVLANPLLREWIGEAYEALLVLERDANAGVAIASLDSIRRSFDGACPIIHRLVEETHEKARGEVAGLRTALHEAETRRLALESELCGFNELKDELAASETELRLAKAELRLTKAELAYSEVRRREYEISKSWRITEPLRRVARFFK